MTKSQIIDALRTGDGIPAGALQWVGRTLFLGGRAVGDTVLTGRDPYQSVTGYALSRRVTHSMVPPGLREDAERLVGEAVEAAVLTSRCLGDGTTVAEALREGMEPKEVARWLLRWEGKTA